MSAARSVVMAAVVAVAAIAGVLAVASADPSSGPAPVTPIKHLVVIFDENESFDHYFGTYPNAANPAGQPRFEARAGTPAVEGLTPALLQQNPNGFNPKRLDRSQAVPCGQKHGYGDEQRAANGGAMDKFVENTQGSCTDPGMVMNYYDGNTVTALWYLAQHFALADHSFGSGYGPSTPGAIELISGNTHGMTVASVPGQIENSTMIGDPQPVHDDCSNPGAVGEYDPLYTNVGDLMTSANMTWGWFQGGFKPTATVGGKAVCGSTHANVAGGVSADYIPHHEPFQYYASTANPHHLRPTGAIGQTDQAKHQYDLTDFDTALRDGLPDVSFLKAAAFEDGHPGYSGPLDEQRFIARTLNAIQQTPEWDSTAVIIAYDDSDGWYDHVFGEVKNPSQSGSDSLNGPGQCGVGGPADGFQGRCGLGPRVPLLVVSPYARQNFVYTAVTEQASILKFIEDNWTLGSVGNSSFDTRAGSLLPMFDFAAGPVAPKLKLDESTGLPPGGTITPLPTTTPGPSPSPTPIPTPKPFKLTCKATGSGRKVTVKCGATGDGATTVTTSLKLRVERSRKLVVSASKTLSRGKATIVLKPKHKLKRGTYTVRIAVKRAGKTTTTKITFRVKK
jgi:phospholipase C